MNKKEQLFIKFIDQITKHSNNKVLPVKGHESPESHLVPRC